MASWLRAGPLTNTARVPHVIHMGLRLRITFLCCRHVNTSLAHVIIHSLKDFKIYRSAPVLSTYKHTCTYARGHAVQGNKPFSC